MMGVLRAAAVWLVVACGSGPASALQQRFAPARLGARRGPGPMRLRRAAAPRVGGRRRTALRAEDEDDIDFDAAFRARIVEDDIVAFQLPEKVVEQLDMAKMAIIGSQGVAVGFAALAASLAFLFTGIYFTGSKSPTKQQDADVVDAAPKVCITCKKTDENAVRALQFDGATNAAAREAARVDNPRAFSE